MGGFILKLLNLETQKCLEGSHRKQEYLRNSLNYCTALDRLHLSSSFLTLLHLSEERLRRAGAQKESEDEHDMIPAATVSTASSWVAAKLFAFLWNCFEIIPDPHRILDDSAQELNI